MTIIRGTNEFLDLFDRAQTLETTPGHNGWTVKDTSAAGTPTYAVITENGGALQLACEATSEAQIITAFHNDILCFDLADIKVMEIIAKVQGIDAVTTLVMGLANAQNDTDDSVTNHAWFRMEGSASTANLLVETDDGTNDNNDVATGDTLANVYLQLLIDFENGLSDVRFYADGARVADGTTFDMSNVTAGQNVQPYIQLQKASGTGVPSVEIAKCRISYNYNYGA